MRQHFAAKRKASVPSPWCLPKEMGDALKLLLAGKAPLDAALAAYLSNRLGMHKRN